MSERPRMSTSMMCGLDQQPPDVAVTLFGDSSMKGTFCALVHGGNQSEVGGQLASGLKAPDVADRSDNGVCSTCPYTWQRHQQFHGVTGIGVTVDLIHQALLFASQCIERKRLLKAS